MPKKYVVRLTDQERAEVNQIVKKFKGTNQKVRRAQMLLKADADGPNWTDQEIAEAFGCRCQTVENVRRHLVERGFALTLNGVKRAAGPTPKRTGWSAGVAGHRDAAGAATDRVRELELTAAGAAGSGITNRRYDQSRDGTAHAKKNGMTNRKIEYWVIPPEADAEFAAGMEEVLETYAQPYDAAKPVLCMDEQPVQLLKETRTPIPATADHGRRVDYEYERAGTANIFMFTEPLAGWRQVDVRATKTKVDWAIAMAGLLENRYGHCEKIVLVCDNLNTHTKGAFYEAFGPERARQLVGRIEFRHTPKHGSWLNIAENELSSLTRQCVAGRRFGDIENLRHETSAWSSDVNNQQKGVEWHMKVDEARIKLASVYPKIMT